ncbi:MAG TPA: nucleotide-binding domain containing protein [Streptosporangiaceae bacterium]|nr:nucleotide-binding domain containing protein [Streptosporangiaceae bacterium]
MLLIPAFTEAGRLTIDDIHWARMAAGLVPVGETEFARDPAFGYAASDLKDFVAEKARGAVKRDDVVSISLTDVRSGGPDRVRDLLAGLHDGTWVVVNASKYSDLETVACGVLLAEHAGKRLLFRTGPSFVRALTGTEPVAPLRGARLWPDGRREGHGLIVVGSHVGQTSRQLAALRAGAGITGIELSVPDVLSGTTDPAASAATQVADGLRRSDVVLYTSRGVAVGDSPERSLQIARTVSAAVARTVRYALGARPAWVLAKGGITAHDVALHGLGIRRGEVAGQLFPGLISVLRPVDAAPEALGAPYVVFAGNVGDDSTLAQVVAILSEPGVAGDQ